MPDLTKRYDYITADVFTDTLFGGNPLAVFPDARGLSGEVMQRIATEFNYSEITFVFPPTNPADHIAKVRIFTPTAEIPFAGHPNVGTAYILGQAPNIFGKTFGDTLRFEERAGTVEVQLLKDSGLVVGAQIMAPRPLSIAHHIECDIIAHCISLDARHISTAVHSPLMVSVGLPFAIAEIDSLEKLGQARPNANAFDAADAKYQHLDDRFSVFLYFRAPEDPFHIRARMFAPLSNILEDPATGSASAALAAYLASLLPDPEGELQFIIDQGIEMGRPSRIEATVHKQAGKIASVWIGGRCVIVMKGSLECSSS